MTENSTFNAPTDMDGQNHMTMDGNFAHMALVSVAQPNSLGGLNNQNQIMAGFPVLSMLQGELINDLQADLNITNRFGILDSDSLIPRNTPLGNSCQIGNAEVHERFMNGLPISASSLSALFAAKCIPHENVAKTFPSNDYADALKSSFEASMNCGCEEMYVDTNNKWGCNKFLSPPEVVGKVQPFQLIENMELNGLVLSESANMNSDSPSGSSKFSNELSLSLSTCRPSVICGTTIPDQCSEISYSCVARNPHLGSEQTSCSSKNLSRSFGSYRSDGLSELLYGSKYLHVIQEILAQIACYSLENFDQMSYSALGSDGFSDGNNRFELQMDPMLQGREIEAKKKQLLALLQVVDDRYNQCLDEIHTVISAFHAATELDPHVHARFSLQTISFLYKNLRERISNQILAMGAHFSKGDTREEEGSFESSFIQKQWALQQLRRKDHQLWRPQRGLPERSVSVLRAWMFQNFLHPYPKDSEKHLLAVKSGLTRSQVSNWFINARVRLWKPMIEEMYCEMNRRKGRRNDEERDSNERILVNIENHRFKMN